MFHIKKFNCDIAPFVYFKLSENYIPKQMSSYESSNSQEQSSNSNYNKKAKIGIQFKESNDDGSLSINDSVPEVPKEKVIERSEDES